jgi:ATP-dependent DNA helicase RecG
MTTLDVDAALGSVVGGKTAAELENAFGMRSVFDMLSHYPRRYVDPAGVSDLGRLTVGEQITVLAEVISARSFDAKKQPPKPNEDKRGYTRKHKGRAQIVIGDGSGQLTLVFFNQPWREKQCRPGRRGLFEGTVSRFGGTYQLTHPRFILLPDDPDDPDYAESMELFTGRLIPIYPATAKLASWRISRTMEMLLKLVRESKDLDERYDPLPQEVRQREGLMGLSAAWLAVHQPKDLQQAEEAKRRLRFDEAFALQVILAQRREKLRAVAATPRERRGGGLLHSFDQRLPFPLTDAQVRVGEEIFTDLATGHPMHRLLQGDVGSGKTLIALRAMLAVVDAGAQAVLLAPTEVLAQQHFATLSKMLGPLAQAGMLGSSDDATALRLITGSVRSRERRESLAALAQGTAGIVVGTHALLEDSVHFADLGLVVIDEQHRFGVEQRAALTRVLPNGTRPHVLVMTATPIPRTVAMTVFGDLDVSVLDEAPPGRQPIATHVVVPREKPAFAARVWSRIFEEVAAGHKAYVVCPRIGDSGSDDDVRGDSGSDGETDPGDTAITSMSSVLDVVVDLRDRLLPGLRIGMLHGRMSAEAKEQVMGDFAADHSDPRALDVLVATTVIEVGVDVPQATVMVILDADRFGISQLHQLRGRVGRGGAASLCLLVTSAAPGSAGRERLDAVASTTDGFALARLDLQARREGDVLGSMQSGRRSSLQLLRVLRDEDIVKAARDIASEIVAKDPDLREHRPLRAAVGRVLDQERSDYLDKG